MSSEYHHYIPQFLVKNYAHPYECPNAKDGHKCSKKTKCKHDRGMYPGDPILNCVDLTSIPFRLETRSVKRTFGDHGMYHDPSRATTKDQRRIETLFSKMESQACSIFRRIVRGFEQGERGAVMTRHERDLLRKFLFLLKYRGSGFHRRFYHLDPGDYSENDRDRLLPYMRAKGFVNPMDVWFHNIETIVTLKMDPEKRWMSRLMESMFPDDAGWFIMHVNCYYMAICTPTDGNAEFILTDNSYNIFEGPNTFVYGTDTGQVHGGAHAAFHEFAPLSPSLMLVLRSFVLPNLQEDADPRISQARQNDAWLAIGQVFGSDRESLLQDLPVRKALNSYSYIIGDRVYPGPGHDGKHRLSDQFLFPFFKVSKNHVEIINNISLENAYPNRVLVYKSKENLRKILSKYISGPCDMFKIVGGEHSTQLYKYLRALEEFGATILGLQASLVWRPMSPPPMVNYKNFRAKQTHYRDVTIPFSQTEAKTVSKATKDFFTLLQKMEPQPDVFGCVAQAGKMIVFQKLVELGSSGCPEHIRDRNRDLVRAAIRSVPCAKYWIYLKLRRRSRYGNAEGFQDVVDLVADDDVREGPEDAFAATNHLFDTSKIVSLMELTVNNDFRLRDYGIDNIWTLSQRQRRNLIQRTRLPFYSAGNSAVPQNETFGHIFENIFKHVFVFSTAGGIRNCGIRKLELAAALEHSRCHASDAARLQTGFTEDQRAELRLRYRMREQFLSVMEGEADDGDLRRLASVLFSLTFPTPPTLTF